MSRLAGKVAVITGGASGMGRATVMRFMSEGASVMVGDVNADALASLVADVARAGSDDRLRTMHVDVAQESDISAMFSGATQAFGKLDIAFNNAGIGGAIGPITELDVEHWDFTFAVLTRSVFLGTKHAARIMIEQGHGGAIVNTASIAGMGGGNGPTAYSAAKSAVISLTQNTALELAPHRIRVNCICPGMIFTPLMHRGDEARAEQSMRDIQPWPDRGEGQHIANAALYLTEDGSDFVTGQAHVIDGGYLANGRIADTAVAGVSGRFVGVTYGSTGKAPQVRKIEPS
jgi:NAD(P)-dependent dehydrogenase (short-subunit alcohol dehydrogenase family)